MQNEITLYGFNPHSIAHLEAKGLAKCFDAYASVCEEISQIGFNPNSGYVYIALDNGIQIASMLGQDIEYIVVDHDGTEHFLDTYESAENFFEYK
jgi:hypothetical protein